MTPEKISINILNQSYQVACPLEQRDDLISSAKHLDQQMSQLKASNKSTSIERLAIMAALNIAHELLLETRKKEKQNSKISDYVQKLRARTKENNTIQSNKQNEAIQEAEVVL